MPHSAQTTAPAAQAGTGKPYPALPAEGPAQEQSRHTPGPWQVCPIGTPGGPVYKVAGSGWLIGTVGFEPNAQLIAAAPDLLAALKGMINEIDLGCRMRSAPVQAALEAIARAEGRQP